VLGAAPRCVVLRLTRNVAARTHALAGHSDGETLFGAPPPDELDFVENGLRFAADVVRGQKTGFFLDQRENRARVAGLAAGRRVLNVCAYSGGFSVYAAHGGAKQVVSLDLSAPALAAAVANFALNAADPQVAACGHTTLCGDAFELLAEIARSDERFDLVVLDPPAFAKRRDEVEGALAAYARLVRLGLGVLARGGVLVACSCSTRIDERQFAAVVASAARAERRTLRVLASTGHPADHPATRELRYLKAIFAVAD
jgi:23S rRNA (cytosine1962-C5)-methyltransferase